MRLIADRRHFVRLSRLAAAAGAACARRGAGADRDHPRPARSGEEGRHSRLVHLDRTADRGEDRQSLRGGASRHQGAGRTQRLRAHRPADRAGARQQHPRRRRRRMLRHDGAVRIGSAQGWLAPFVPGRCREIPGRPARPGRVLTRPTASPCRRSSTTRSSSSPRTRRKASPTCSTRNGRARSSRRIPAIAARS